MASNHYVSPQVYTDYYTRQVGQGMPVFSGGMTQQGFGLGGLLARGFRAAIPFLKRGTQAVVKKAFKKGGRSLARKAVNAGIDFAAGALTDRLDKTIGTRNPPKRKRAMNLRQHNTAKRTRVITSHKRRKQSPGNASRARVITKRRTPDIFDV